MDLGSFLTNVLTSAATATVVIGAFGWFGREWIAGWFKVRQAKATFEHSTRFGIYHKRQADAIAALFEACTELQHGYDELITSLREWSDDEHGERVQLWERTSAAYGRLRKIVDHNRYLFNDRMRDILAQIPVLNEALLDGFVCVEERRLQGGDIAAGIAALAFAADFQFGDVVSALVREFRATMLGGDAGEPVRAKPEPFTPIILNDGTPVVDVRPDSELDPPKE